MIIITIILFKYCGDYEIVNYSSTLTKQPFFIHTNCDLDKFSYFARGNFICFDINLCAKIISKP